MTLLMKVELGHPHECSRIRKELTHAMSQKQEHTSKQMGASMCGLLSPQLWQHDDKCKDENEEGRERDKEICMVGSDQSKLRAMGQNELLSTQTQTR
jgi:hypothetical protein